MKRNREPNNFEMSRKIINMEGKAISVNEGGSAAQRRTALTVSVSPDAVRFVPPQVRKKGPPS
jgi:hypothetical protein